MTIWDSVRGFMSTREDLVMKLDASEARRMELARENMTLSADLSTARTKTADLESAIDQLWRDSDGHNFCQYNLPRFFTRVGKPVKPLRLPPLDERMEGCKVFWAELEANAERWSDFSSMFLIEEEEDDK